MKKVIILAVLFPLWGLGGLYAQLTTNEQPYGLQQRNAGQSKQSYIVLPPPDVRQLAIEDSINNLSRIAMKDSISVQVQGGGTRFAYPVLVNYTPYNSGVWEQLPNGDKLWRLKVKIPDALSTITYYEKFWLPKGCKFFVYSEETGQFIGAVTSEFIGGEKANPIKFATALIYGESVVYELYQPAYVSDTAIIHIDDIDYGYRHIRNPYQSGGGSRGNSNPCNEDICDPSANDLLLERNAVTMITVRKYNSQYYLGTEYFTGYLINNTNNDNTPYVLTFIGTLFDISDPNQWLFYFDYTSCTSGSNPNPPLQGATIVANASPVFPNYYDAGFALLLLKQDPLYITGFTPYYLGWDRTGNTTQTGAGIHHPKGDCKKYFRYDDINNTPGYICATGLLTGGGQIGHPHGSLWEVTLNLGYAESESWGAPLLNSNNRVIGTFMYPNMGGSCNNNFKIHCEKFSHEWTGGGAASPANRLMDWLDPCNTGATILDGIGVINTVQGIVQNTTTWSTPMEATGDIIIPNGVTLTITSVVKCNPNVKITVQSGGKLIVDGGTLTNSVCDGDLWQGIVIMDNYNPFSNPLPQGIVELINGARIENAVCGIHVKRSLGGGGSVYADNAYFRNNQQAVYFAPFISGIPRNITITTNASYFKNCKFTLNNAALFNQVDKAQVELQGVNGISFTNCTFEDNRTNDTAYYITGIYANASNIKVGNYSPIMLETSGGCSFSGFNRAIHIINSNTPSQIYAGTFTNNHIGIEADGVQDFNIGNCQFQILAPAHFSENVGVYLRYTSLYNIVNNHFEGAAADNTIGIITENSGKGNIFVKSNTLKNLCTGCLAIGNNRNDTNQSQGLVYQCNKFENNGKDIRVAENSQIRFHQTGSDFTKATGNIFNSSVYNLYIEGGCFDYVFLSGNPIHNPSSIYIVNYPANFVLKNPANSDYCCQSYGYAGDYYYSTWCAKPWDNENLTTLNNSYITAKEIYNTKEVEYIETGFNSTIINWERPDVQYIIERLEMADGDEFTITIQGNAPGTSIEKQVVLYYELSNLKQQMDMMCYTALDILSTDEEELDMEQYRTWIGRFNTAESDYLLSDLYIASGEFAEALGILDSMPSKFEGLNLETHQDYLDYFAVVQNIPDFEEGYTIPRSLINELVRLSSKNNFVAIKAYSFGEMLFDDWTENYPRDFSVHPACVCSYDGSSPIQKSMSSGEGESFENKSFKEKVSENEKTQITIKPNPTTGLLKIECGQLKIENYIIYNVVGQSVQQGNLSDNAIVNVEFLANGMYFITFHSEGQKITKKFVKE